MRFVESHHGRVSVGIYEISGRSALFVFGGDIAKFAGYAQQLFPGQMRWELHHDYAMHTTLWFWSPALNLTNGWFDPISSRLTRWLRAQARRMWAVSSSLPISCRASRWDIIASCKLPTVASNVLPKTAIGRSTASPFHTSSSRQRRAKTGIASTLEALSLFSPKILSSTDTRWKPSVFCWMPKVKRGELTRRGILSYNPPPVNKISRKCQ